MAVGSRQVSSNNPPIQSILFPPQSFIKKGNHENGRGNGHHERYNQTGSGFLSHNLRMVGKKTGIVNDSDVECQITGFWISS